ncbi:filaggrin-like [Gadus macrocephalus]|uniref:filaggrin-like n=1 Tax=Gadus macrocephalus TaxID=80720 RepID=UPI0028CB6819|nr:filaggrin-like [Gadus macrocephalus]
MPKEPGHFGERVGRSTSKNAKDRSNSATVRADRGRRTQAGPGALGGMGDMGQQLSLFDSGKDSEKDSGYSEAGSDWVDDQCSSVSQTHRKNSRRSVTAGNHGSAGVGRFEGHNPVIKNLLVKPSRQEQMLHRQLASWAGGWHSISGPQGPSQLLEIQQPAVTAPSSSTLTTYLAPVENLSKANKKGCTSRTSGKNHHSSTKNSYLPITHPRKEGHAQGKSAGAPAAGQEGGGGGVGGEDQSHCKRVCTEDELKTESVSTTTRHLSSHHHRHGRHRDLHPSQHKVRRGSEPPAHPPPAHPPPANHTKPNRCSHHSYDALGSPSVSSSQTASLPSSHSSSSHSPSSSCSSSSSSYPTSYSSSSVSHSPFRPRQGRAGSAALVAAAAAMAVAADAAGQLLDAPSECSSVRQRRFLHTAEILSQSGLLAITLRTKELQRQSDATERDIAQLRLHTQLLCQAALAGQQVANDGSNGLQHLLQAMARSGAYPGLVSGAQVKAGGGRRRQSVRRGEAAKGESKEADERKEADESKEADEQGRLKDGTLHQEPMSPQGADKGVSSLSPFFGLSPEAERMEQVNSLAGSLSMDRDVTDPSMTPESFTLHNYLF